jgi:glycosyltransferase involved in cell wall biosynthesis
MRAAIVHDWLPLFSGAEEVVANLMAVIGPSDLFTLFNLLSAEDEARLGAARIVTSYLDRLPGRERYYRSTFPFCPQAIESFDLSSYDLVLSSSAAFSKGVIVHPHQKHVSYVHTPVRYAWDQTYEYLASSRALRGLTGVVLKHLLHQLRVWDSRTGQGPDLMIANSSTVRRRIEQIYGRQALIVAPPVDTGAFALQEKKDDYFFAASRLVPYKRMDVLVDAFTAMPGSRLLLAGDGPDLSKLKKRAGPNVEFLGKVSRSALIAYMAGARAFVFAGYEDFGIVMAEAQASGTPVIAYKQGGAADIVVPLGQPHPTGILFSQQTAASLQEAIGHFNSAPEAISPIDCRTNAMRFSVAKFREKMQTVLSAVADERASRSDLLLCLNSL